MFVFVWVDLVLLGTDGHAQGPKRTRRAFLVLALFEGADNRDKLSQSGLPWALSVFSKEHCLWEHSTGLPAH